MEISIVRWPGTSVFGTRLTRLRRRLGIRRSILPTLVNTRIDRYRLRRRRRPGLPEGLGRESIERVALEQTKMHVVRCSHEPLRSWKSSRVAHVELELSDGSSLFYVFKDAIYDDADYPAVAGLDHPVGFPESSLYRLATSDPLAYAPQVFCREESADHVRQTYLLEDVAQTHHPVYSERDKRPLLEAMPVFHENLERWVARNPDHVLLVYDRDFVVDLLEHARRGLERLASTTDFEGASDVRSVWSDVADYLLDSRNLRRRDLRPIHGDFSTTNAFVARRGIPKLVDWEWSAMGTRHDEIASLVKRRDPRLEEKALDMLANLEPRIGRRGHEELLWWSRAFTVVRDAALLSHQYVGTPDPPDFVLERALGLWHGYVRTARGLRVSILTG